MSCKVEKCEFEEIKPLSSLATKDHVSVSNTSNTQWFKVVLNGKLIGCGALMKKKSPTGRVKGIFIKKEFRNKGYGLKLTNVLIKDGVQKKCTAIDLYTWHPKFWEKLKYKAIGKNSHGAIRMLKGV